MRVLYILPYDWGGMPHYTAEIANSISVHEDVYILGSNQINKTYFENNIKIIECFESLDFSNKSLKNLISFKNIKCFISFKRIRVINDIKPDIIHIPTPLIPPLVFFFLLYGYDKSYPLIYTKHSVFANTGLKKSVFNNITYLCEFVLRIKKVILHTEMDKIAFLNKNNKQSDEVEVIPHGSYSFFKKYSQYYPIRKNCILFFGNIGPYKGLKYLINAVPLIYDSIPDLKVIIAGKGDISEYCAVLNKYNEVFEIHNEFISDEKVSEYFQQASLVVMPYSKMSGQSGVLNVAVAFNKPVVASNVGGIDEVIIEGVNGYLVPPNDSVALADAIVNILTDEELRRKMECNMEQTNQDFSWENIANKYLFLYKDVVEHE